jgi:single-stranded-DNA-specific exonuclease
MVWKKLPVSAQEMRRLHEQYGLDVLSASILARRGQTSSEQVKFFFGAGAYLFAQPLPIR